MGEENIRVRRVNNGTNGQFENGIGDSEFPVRRRSNINLLTKSQKLDIRAHQRTYQGAYIRTCIGTLSFSLLVMKLFSVEFLSIGIVFQVYSLILCVIGYSRAKHIELYFNTEDDGELCFKTSGNYVLLLSLITGSCLIVLFILLIII